LKARRAIQADKVKRLAFVGLFPATPCLAPKGNFPLIYYRGANTIGIELTHNWDHLHGSYFGGAVPPFTFARGSTDLDELERRR
jgi:hypothetical protein